MDFSVLKQAEGGPNRKCIMQRLRDAGFTCSPKPSPYVGHVGIAVNVSIDNTRKLRQVERIVYGH